jgi:hypothetical protein
MLCIDECRSLAFLLDFSNSMKRDRRLTGRFWSIDLYYPAFGIPASQNQIQNVGSAVEGVHHPDICIVSHPHDGSFTELLLDAFESFL